MRILFLGAGKRLSLLETFIAAGRRLQIPLDLIAAETSMQLPIARAARIVIAPKFKEAEFEPWLIDFVTRESIDMVVPNMDAATVALSAAREPLERLGAWPVVSTHELCRIMEDKAAADRWFREQGVDVPGSDGWPRIFKHRTGFGARDQFVVQSDDERAAFCARVNTEEYFEQAFIEGPEYTVDAYVDRAGEFVTAMPRLRLKVLAGEVEESLSAQHRGIETATRRIFSNWGWQGPLTAQFIDTSSGPKMIEINPRFGGGVTHAIHCGLDFPAWLILERMGQPIEKTPSWTSGSFMTRCRRDIFL